MNVDDHQRLAIWLEANSIAYGPVTDVCKLSGGTQNLLFRFSASGQSIVLRRPSQNARPGADKTIGREARVVAALAGTQVPHARFRGFCNDIEVIGSIFLLTDEVVGANVTVAMPETAAANPKVRHAMGLAMVKGLVALAGVDHLAQGLEDFGRLDNFIERQVPRWASQLDSYAEHARWPGPDALAGVFPLGLWLNANRPAQSKGGLMHGDYHIANVLFRDDGALAAILDWEMAALGDPLLDLGRLLAAWPDPDGSGPLSLKVTPWQGFPQADELIARYAEGTGRDLTDLLWYQILACYKLAIILEGTFARACAGLVERDVGVRLHNSALQLIARATLWLEKNG